MSDPHAELLATLREARPKVAARLAEMESSYSNWGEHPATYRACLAEIDGLLDAG